MPVAIFVAQKNVEIPVANDACVSLDFVAFLPLLAADVLFDLLDGVWIPATLIALAK